MFYRFGRDRPQPFLEAIGNPRRDAADAREMEEGRVLQEEYRAQVRKAAEEQAAKKAVEAAREAARREELRGRTLAGGAMLVGDR
ncbi:hypothetical protein ACIP3B_36515 [Streptomyces anulatus]|uniref:hypothetical protein n=1 Tax=Streptomyces anulatus TaxID=1892 RepID=UPI0033D623AD